ncbi:MAG: hypothetical protein II621_08245, partial [Clostridia bacterium]|nr:hypothetical protein [Clostridia bacterium]
HHHPLVLFEIRQKPLPQHTLSFHCTHVLFMSSVIIGVLAPVVKRIFAKRLHVAAAFATIKAGRPTLKQEV